MAPRITPSVIAETALNSIGLGFDLTTDMKLKYCKRSGKGSRLIEIDEDGVHEVVLPGGVSLPNVPTSIKFDKGERTRFRSEVVSFQQMSEQFNQEMCLTGKIPSGYFNTMFEFSGCWQKDEANTRSLAFDGVFVTLYAAALEKSSTVLADYVKAAVPPSWNPAALAKFIETFGTHIVVGLKIGGNDVIYVKQYHSSSLQLTELQKLLKEMADKRFSDTGEQHCTTERMCMVYKDMLRIYRRRGGSDKSTLSHTDWLQTVQSEPDVISMSFVPITSLLNGIPGSGFLGHAINLYLRYKPPIDELHQFLEFQLPKQWAPVYSELPLGPELRQHKITSLQFSPMGPKLLINTTPVDVGKKPVTGMRLYLEGKRNNRMAVHLQHLSSLPKTFQLKEDTSQNPYTTVRDNRYYEKVQWKYFSHVCTAPVESKNDFSIVTGAQLLVENHGIKNILFLRLRFSTVVDAAVVKQPQWDGPSGFGSKSGFIATLITQHFSSTQKPSPLPTDVNINSAVYPGGPPVPIQAPRLLKFVDTREMLRGPQEPPGYWVVSGARLVVENGRISLHVKYSLLTVASSDDDDNLLQDDQSAR